MSCEAFTAMSYCPPDAITVTTQGASYVSPDESRIEVKVPENCFSTDVTLEVRVSACLQMINETLLEMIILEMQPIFK